MPDASPAACSAPSDPDQLSLSVPDPRDGRSLRFHADELVLRWVAELAQTISRTPEFTLAARLFDADMVMMHVENVLHSDLFDICAAYTRRRYLQAIGLPSPKPVFCDPALFPFLKEHWLDESIPLLARRAPLHLLRTIARRRHRVFEVFRRPATTNLPPILDYPTVAVELAEGVDPLKKSDAFWLAAGAVQPRQVLFVFELASRPFLDVEKELAAVKKLGARCVALHPSVSAGGKVPLWIPGAAPAWLNAFCSSLGRVEPSFGAWLPRALKGLARSVWRWESFFRHHNVAIYQQFTELSLETAARRIAADRVHGIEIGKMRSQFFDRASASFYFQHEVAFVWHENAANILRDARTRTREIVAVGYPWGHLFSTMAAEANVLRRGLIRPGVTRVLAVYDNGAHLNTTMSVAQLETFYAYLLDLAERRTDIALLVKSKKPHILRAMPKIKASLADLEAKGRCVVLDTQLSSVIPAALAADLVVAIPASTAACEAALVGREVLMYDPGRSRDHAFSGRDKGIMHDDFAQFARALEAVLARPLQIAGANASRYLHTIDPFCDGRAAWRAAAYIAGFLEAKKHNLEKAAAMEAAKRHYDAACSDAAARVETTPPGGRALSEGAR
jgi:hypothetical protein